jgi:hypothetical protein
MISVYCSYDSIDGLVRCVRGTDIDVNQAVQRAMEFISNQADYNPDRKPRTLIPIPTGTQIEFIKNHGGVYSLERGCIKKLFIPRGFHPAANDVDFAHYEVEQYVSSPEIKWVDKNRNSIAGPSKTSLTSMKQALKSPLSDDERDSINRCVDILNEQFRPYTRTLIVGVRDESITIIND